MIQALRRFVVEDALLKGVSLLCAIALFVVVRADKDATTGLYVRVIYQVPKDRVLVSNPPGELRIVVRGPWTRVSRLVESDLEPIRLDLANLPAGDVRINEEMIRLPVGVRLASIAPPQLRITLEPRVERLVPIQPTLGGEPAAGYRVGKSSARPAKVRVVGARSVVDALPRVATHPLLIAEARGAVRGEVSLEAPPPHADYEPADSVTVEVEIVPLLAERVQRAVSVRLVGLARMEGHLEPAVAEVVLRGPAEALAGVAAGAPSLLVDAQAEETRPGGSFRKRIGVAGLPANVAAEIRPESVTLTTKRRGRF